MSRQVKHVPLISSISFVLEKCWSRALESWLQYPPLPPGYSRTDLLCRLNPAKMMSNFNKMNKSKATHAVRLNGRDCLGHSNPSAIKWTQAWHHYPAIPRPCIYKDPRACCWNSTFPCYTEAIPSKWSVSSDPCRTVVMSFCNVHCIEIHSLTDKNNFVT